MSRILVVYGTSEGQTAKIAAFVADVLRAHRLETTLALAGPSAPDLDGYDGVIVAASVHGGRYQPSVKKWVVDRAARLNGTPSAFFSVSLGVLQREAAVRKQVNATVAGFLEDAHWSPQMVKSVAGALLYTRYGWFKRWLMKRIVAKAGGDTDTRRDYEYTDWNELQACVSEFARRVHARGEDVATARQAS